VQERGCSLLFGCYRNASVDRLLVRKDDEYIATYFLYQASKNVACGYA
ncbi:uncharacterized protein METZ01_LOCUS457176, partial [marine metagenome]